MLIVWQGVLTGFNCMTYITWGYLLLQLFFFTNYTALLMLVYGCKMEKTHVGNACHRAGSMQDLFLEAQEQWAKDGPHVESDLLLHEYVPACWPTKGPKRGQSELSMKWASISGYASGLDPEVGMHLPSELLHPEPIDREPNPVRGSTWRSTSYTGCYSSPKGAEGCEP